MKGSSPARVHSKYPGFFNVPEMSGQTRKLREVISDNATSRPH